VTTPAEKDIERAREIGHCFIRYFLHDSEWALKQVAQKLIKIRQEGIKEGLARQKKEK